ncbi:unnamed protein product [Gadus morhua 'NCC']
MLSEQPGRTAVVEHDIQLKDSKPTRLSKANIQCQQDELLQIQDELQKVQGQNIQMGQFLLQGPGGLIWAAYRSSGAAPYRQAAL